MSLYDILSTFHAMRNRDKKTEVQVSDDEWEDFVGELRKVPGNRID